MGQKRQRDSKSSTFHAKKRKKAENATAADSDDGWDGIVGADELNWKEVALPDRLEDAGGFFGLEEIEGVDIVRGSGNGEVKFKAVVGKPKKSILKKKAPEDEKPEYDEEWSGFSDDDDADRPENASSPAVEKLEKSDTKADKKSEKEAKDAKKKESKAAKKEQKEKGSAIQHDTSINAGLSFAALQDTEEDDGADVSAWDSLGLSPEILTGLSKMKFASPTSVQEACIPQILEGHDVIGKASTGSGKTLAFGIPILEHYLEKKRDDVSAEKGKKSEKDSTPIALILSPTRELAHQLSKHIGELIAQAPGINARIALLTGGLSVQKQQRLLSGADIVIGTPGRVWEILSTGQGLIRKMQQIKFLVVDEADRLLSEGHFKEVEEILNALDRVEDGEVPDGEDQTSEEESDPSSERQTLVFSATFHRDLQQKLAGKGNWTGGDVMDKKESMDYLLQKLNFREEKPKFIDMNPVSQMADNLKEGIVECGAMEKDLFLYTLLLYHPKHRTLVFTNSISAVRRLTKLLQTLQLPALALHSSMAQKARLRSVERFSSPSSDPCTILIATDVAARADAYVHRSGRTARAGASGKSVIICGPDEMIGVVRLAAKVHAKTANSKKLPLESLELDRRVVSRVKPRVSLASRITDSNIAKEKISAEDNWLRNAAEDLGVEYDSEEFDESNGKGRGRGRGRQQKQKEVGSVSKAELTGLRAELKQLLSQRVNVGVSERYLTAGRVDIEALLRGEGNSSFLGPVDPLNF
ncbi:ATP-dependent RNA helicase MAK5 [Aspergillus novofumigatus IBT 16806]|uniref:ATP-dependent RNA helicase n=1 Tax=Aspergillus novofumigatus (strain IBT 16806) TaxID=1392255 RepID=A0A2I1CCZ2_ASPN1|nr:putative ATP dependent RNA helicase [Aspergillus novofumigatus IBT 16806]PKX95482.1 putative ATP dependent RNA helicase [Aspergillus novofumigatus IBT 16806]